MRSARRRAAAVLAVAVLVGCGGESAPQQGSAAAATATTTTTTSVGTVEPTGSASVASATTAPGSAQPLSSSAAVSASPAPSASAATPPVSADCVDLVPGKIPERGDADAAPKYRPPEWAKEHAKAFDTSTPAPFKTLKDRYAMGFIQAAIGAQKNPDFAKNWATAKACGIPRGAYQFISQTDGAAQAKVMLEQLKGDFGEVPPTLDLEKPPKCEDECCGDPCSTWRARVDQWLEVVEKETKRPSMIYLVEPFFAQCVCAETKWKERPNWLAAWPKFDFPKKPRLGGFSEWTFYQYEGNVRRYGGVLDLSLFKGDNAAFTAWLAAQK